MAKLFAHAASISLAQASCEGLWSMAQPSGQLLRVDWNTGATESKVPALSTKGWELPSCSSSAVDQTGKWYYQFARRNASSPWSLVVERMFDGLILYVQDLPSSLGAPADPCSFMVATTGDWGAYVARAVHDSNLMVIFYGWENTDEAPTTRPKRIIETVYDGPAPSGLGKGAPFPSATLATNLLWLQLESGVALLNLTSSQLSSAVQLAPQQRLSALQFDGSEDSIFALLQDPKKGTAVASFSADVASKAELKVLSTWFPDADREDSAAAYLIQQRQFAIRRGSKLFIYELNGTEAGAVKIQWNESLSSMHYEPFVFSTVVV